MRSLGYGPSFWWSSRQEESGQEVPKWSVLRCVCCERLFWAIMEDSTERVLDGGKVGSHFVVIMVMIWGFTCDGRNTKHFIYITSFNPYSHLTKQYFYLHFTEEQTGVQRGKYSYSRSHGWSYSKPVLWSQRRWISISRPLQSKVMSFLKCH